MANQTPPELETKTANPGCLRRFFVWTGIFAGVSVLLLVLLAVFFQDEITQKVIRTLAKSLKTELKIREAKLSLFSGFPSASVDLRGVQLNDSQRRNLLEAEEMGFRFDLFSLFGSNIEVNSVVFKNGALAIRTDRNGEPNYEIFRGDDSGKTKSPTTDDGLAIQLQNAEFQDFELIYENRQTRQTAQYQIENAQFAGNFSSKKYQLTSAANLTVGMVEVDSSRYLAGEKISWDAVIAVDMTQDLYDLQGVELRIGGNSFATDGVVIAKPDFTDFNLKLVSQEGDISMVVNLLPGKYREYFSDFESAGTYSCGGTVKGRLGKNQTPTVSFSVNLKDGKVTSDKLQGPLRDVSFKAIYTARPDGSGNFDISGFRGSFGGQPLNFDLKISNFDDPDVDFRFNGVLPLASTYGLFALPEITGGDGVVRVNSLIVNGKYKDMTSMSRIPNVQSSGEVIFDDAEIRYNKVPVVFKSGAIRLADNVFSTEKLLVEIGDSDFNFDGSAANLLPVLFSDSLNKTNAFLEFQAKMTSKNVDVDQILAMFSVQETASEVGGQQVLDSIKIEKTGSRESLTSKLKGIFEAEISKFNFEKISGEDFSGKLAFDRNLLLINGLANAMGGKILLDADHHFEEKPFLKMRCTIENIDLPTCLEQCDNFGQEVIKSENIKGRLTGKVAAWAFWDEKGNFQMDKTRALVDVSAKNGELVKVKMFEDFSTYIHVEDLRRVKFTQLQNYLEISNRKLIIPAMFIQSNACNVTLSGTHTFDNDIDYKIKVNAGQVLFNKMKKHDNDLDPLPEKDGWLNLFYVVKGNIDKYDMKRSKKTVKADFERAEDVKRSISTRLETAFREAPKIEVAVAEN